MEHDDSMQTHTRRQVIGAALAGTAGLVVGPVSEATVRVPVRKGYADGRFGQIHYRISQPALAAGHPPLLCFHMSPNSGRIYETFLKHMGADRFAVAPDTPGFGDSDPPATQPAIADYAAAMGDLMDALGFATVDVMGYHTGSETCIELALQRPQQVRRLVLVSAPIFTAAQGGFCRLGPSTIYQEVRTMNAGEMQPILGQSISPVDGISVWWEVEINGLRCYISSGLGSVSGDTSGVPVRVAPPTPTPTPTHTPTATPTATP